MFSSPIQIIRTPLVSEPIWRMPAFIRAPLMGVCIDKPKKARGPETDHGTVLIMVSTVARFIVISVQHIPLDFGIRKSGFLDQLFGGRRFPGHHVKRIGCRRRLRSLEDLEPRSKSTFLDGLNQSMHRTSWPSCGRTSVEPWDVTMSEESMSWLGLQQSHDIESPRNIEFQGLAEHVSYPAHSFSNFELLDSHRKRRILQDFWLNDALEN